MNQQWLHQPQADRITVWSRVYVTVLVLALIGLLSRVVQLKLAPNPQLAEVRTSSYSTQVEFARRGNVYDQRGRLLATSVIGYRLFVDPQEIDDLNEVCQTLGGAIDREPTAIRDTVRSRLAVRPSTRYVVIEHELADWQVEAVRSARLRGVGLQPRLDRHYPHGTLAAALIGRVGFEHHGQGGVELRYDSRLQPSNGRLVYQRDVNRRPLWIDSDGHDPAVNGEDVHLTIDAVIQEIVEKRLAEAVEACNAGGGRAIVLDCRNGDILAMDDILRRRPDWEPVAVDPGRAIHPSLGRNRCVSDPYEPGSTFKPFVWAEAIELGKATPDEVLPTPASAPYRTSRGRAIRDAFYHEDADFQTVLTKSLNSGMAIVAERMSHHQLRGLVEQLGFGRETNCSLPGESPGIVTSRRQWSHYTQTSVPMGHEISVTPVQMVQAFSAFARDGTMPAISLTKPAESPVVTIVQRAYSKDTALTTRQTLRKVMTDGSGQRSQSELYKLFGKSGTPQMPDRKRGGYYENRYTPNFIAAAPLSDSRIVVLVVIDDPDKEIDHYGGIVAGPAVRDIIEQTLIYLGEAPEKTAENGK